MTQRTREMRSTAIHLRLQQIRDRIQETESRLYELPDAIFSNDADLEFFLRHSDVPFAKDAFLLAQHNRIV
jgi:hypothetical protein